MTGSLPCAAAKGTTPVLPGVLHRSQLGHVCGNVSAASRRNARSVRWVRVRRSAEARLVWPWREAADDNVHCALRNIGSGHYFAVHYKLHRSDYSPSNCSTAVAHRSIIAGKTMTQQFDLVQMSGKNGLAWAGPLGTRRYAIGHTAAELLVAKAERRAIEEPVQDVG